MTFWECERFLEFSSVLGHWPFFSFIKSFRLISACLLQGVCDVLAVLIITLIMKMARTSRTTCLCIINTQCPNSMIAKGVSFTCRVFRSTQLLISWSRVLSLAFVRWAYVLPLSPTGLELPTSGSLVSVISHCATKACRPSEKFFSVLSTMSQVSHEANIVHHLTRQFNASQAEGRCRSERLWPHEHDFATLGGKGGGALEREGRPQLGRSPVSRKHSFGARCGDSKFAIFA